VKNPDETDDRALPRFQAEPIKLHPDVYKLFFLLELQTIKPGRQALASNPSSQSVGPTRRGCGSQGQPVPKSCPRESGRGL